MTLEMQRAERRNALNGELVDGLREAVEKAAAEDIRAIVLTGAGTRVQLGCRPFGRRRAWPSELPDKAKALNVAIDKAPVPVIGAINGPAIGAGVILSMICDLRVVAPDAYFQFPVAKYGLALDNWSIRRLTSLVGAGRARGMLLAAERLTADAALQTGMANRIGTLADAQAWAAEIAGFAPLALQHAKRVLNDDGAYEDPWPEHQETVRQGVGQPGRHRGAGGAHREAATEVPGRLMICGRRCASAFGTAIAAGRRLGRCARCRARRPRSAPRPAEIDAVARRSPNYQDGVFVNLEPAIDGQPRPAGAVTARPRGDRLARAPAAGRTRSRWSRPTRASPRRDLAVSWYGHSSAVIEIDGYRVLADPVWSDRCSPSQTVGPRADARGARAAGGAARDRRGRSSATTTTTTSTSTPINGLARTQRATVRRAARASARTCASGASPPTASSNSTGTRAPASATSPWCAPRRGTSPVAF